MNPLEEAYGNFDLEGKATETIGDHKSANNNLLSTFVDNDDSLSLDKSRNICFSIEQLFRLDDIFKNLP